MGTQASTRRKSPFICQRHSSSGSWLVAKHCQLWHSPSYRSQHAPSFFADSGYIFSSFIKIQGNEMTKAWETAYQARTDLTAYGDNALGLFALGLRFNIEDLATVAADAITDGSDDKNVTLSTLMRMKATLSLRNATSRQGKSRARQRIKPLISILQSAGFFRHHRKSCRSEFDQPQCSFVKE